MLALIFGILAAAIESDRIDVSDRDADGDRGQQHQSDHQDYVHVASSISVPESRIDVCGAAQTCFVCYDAQFCMINVPSRCVTCCDAY